jgi:hypothetical protein
MSTGRRYTDYSEVSMPILIRFYSQQIVYLAVVIWMLAGAQATSSAQNKNAQANNNIQGNNNSNNNKDTKNRTPSHARPGSEYSGMYSFLREGEFVQVTVEDHGIVTGFVSRYGNSESDRGVFLDHFFKSGKLDHNQLVFTTETVHAVWFEFRGMIDRGTGRNPGDEAYYVLKGTLIENTTEETQKTSARSIEVALKSFPQDLSSPQAPTK